MNLGERDRFIIFISNDKRGRNKRKIIFFFFSFSFRLMRSQMLAKSQPNLLDIGNDNDSDIYDGTGSLRSGASSNTLNEDEIERENKGKHKV